MRSQRLYLSAEQIVQFHCLLVVLLHFGRSAYSIVAVRCYSHSANAEGTVQRMVRLFVLELLFGHEQFPFHPLVFPCHPLVFPSHSLVFPFHPLMFPCQQLDSGLKLLLFHLWDLQHDVMLLLVRSLMLFLFELLFVVLGDSCNFFNIQLPDLLDDGWRLLWFGLDLLLELPGHVDLDLLQFIHVDRFELRPLVFGLVNSMSLFLHDRPDPLDLHAHQ